MTLLRTSRVDSHEDDEWPGTSPLPGKADRCESVQPREEKVEGALINAYKYLQGGSQADVTRLFSTVPSNRTRGNRHKLKHRKLHLNMRKNSFTLMVTEH